MERTWKLSAETDLNEVAVFVRELMTGMEPEGAYVLALYGDLGAGKTTFMQYLAALFGIEESVTSPTFVIQKQYQTAANTKLVHIDAYRIEHIDEMRVLGFEALLAEKGTIIGIEWAERIADLLPPNTIHLHFSHQGDERKVTITTNQNGN